ncbi:MAG: hypothetical protein KTR30_05125 [Saprospiraceae bacterium]|nr:hypothetical protein [Saprospiraceae bacterium]
MTTRYLLTLCLGLFTWIGLAAHSSPPKEATTKTVFDWLSAGGEVLEVTLESDWSNLIENRKKDLEEPAKLYFDDTNGTAQEVDLKVLLRGKFRRRVCAFPPVKLKFPKKDLKKRGLNNHNDIKLVTHCLGDKKAGNDNVLKEYLTYQMYNALSPKSFRVQLVKITYVDSAKKLPKTKRYGFIIEDTDEMAERLGGVECDCMYPDVAKVDEKLVAQMSMFQYLIGNEDWNLAMGRNLKYVITQGGSRAIPVAYDFDFSGLVNTSYALANVDHKLQSVLDRVYLGHPASDPIMLEAMSKIKAKRSDFETIIKDFSLLSGKGKKEMLSYLDTCYQLLEGLEGAGTRQWFATLSKGTNVLTIPVEPSARGKAVGK